MGGSVILLAKKGEPKKIRKFFNKIAEKIDYYWSLPGPKVGKVQVDRIILEFNDNRVELQYNFGQGDLPQEFAKIFGQALCRRFKFTKAGWDSVGWIPEKEGGLKCFMKSPSFRLERRMLRRKLPGTMKIEEIRKYTKTYKEYVESLFE